MHSDGEKRDPGNVKLRLRTTTKTFPLAKNTHFMMLCGLAHAVTRLSMAAKSFYSMASEILLCFGGFSLLRGRVPTESSASRRDSKRVSGLKGSSYVDSSDAVSDGLFLLLSSTFA